jgi:hypothetical protein
VQLAQLNIARMLAPLTDPVMADFVAALAPVNAAADAAHGFVWRLADESGTGATNIRAFDDEMMLVNLTVWEDAESLAAFVFTQTDHAVALRRRREWFARPERPMVVLWWVENGHIPDVAEAADRLEHLRANGPTPYAFPFRLPVPPPPGHGSAPVTRAGGVGFEPTRESPP